MNWVRNGSLLILFTCAVNVASAESVYMATYGSGSVVRYDGAGQSTVVASGFGSTIGLAFDRRGDLFVGDWDRGQISKIDPAGKVTPFVDVGLFGPMGLAFGPDGDLFVAHRGGQRIVRITPTGEQSIFAAVPLPVGLAFDAGGNLFVSSQVGDKIIKISPSGSLSTFADAADGINWPLGLAFNSAGELFVASAFGSTIHRFDPQGNGSVFAKNDPLGWSNGAHALAFGSDGSLYATWGADRLARYDPSGAVEIFAGTIGGWFIAIPAIPEPETWVLVIAGGACLAAIQWFNRR